MKKMTYKQMNESICMDPDNYKEIKDLTIDDAIASFLAEPVDEYFFKL